MVFNPLCCGQCHAIEGAQGNTGAHSVGEESKGKGFLGRAGIQLDLEGQVGGGGGVRSAQAGSPLGWSSENSGTGSACPCLPNPAASAGGSPAG